MNKKEKLFIVLGIIFISFNLRAPITAVGSIIDLIKSEHSLSNGASGFITTLPLITFAIVSPFVSQISEKLKHEKTILLGLLFILAGEYIRSYTNLFGIFLGTTFLGIGIAIGNVLIPSIIKSHFKNNAGPMVSIYTSSMCIFAAVGAGISVPLAKGLELGWKNTLAVWIVLTLTTILIWSPQLTNNSAKNVTKQVVVNDSTSIWKSKLAWGVTIFMGLQSLLFYSLVAWLPTMITTKGMSDMFAGTMALTFQLTAIPATLIIPILCDKFSNQKIIVSIICLLYLTGILLFLLGNSQFIILMSVIFMSLGMGGSISLSIAFISLKTANASRASQLSGMSQSAGYLLAALGPITTGVIYDITQNWAFPLVIFMLLIFSLFFCGLKVGRNVVIQ